MWSSGELHLLGVRGMSLGGHAVMRCLRFDSGAVGSSSFGGGEEEINEPVRWQLGVIWILVGGQNGKNHDVPNQTAEALLPLLLGIDKSNKAFAV